ncbi:MBL fold metallo-hydrolase [Dawidia soli]|uniref:MBL fold metallo-hydrolase n=1 Tax=Dawidia soli TaxID=2782352 RepID=A0AAP2DH67_9BACT|nr:MBL fold metallo-hydrolase [Dawidia soli]MBT1690765.1 MBL fold metallo-hydrolase [Dawidia soli]
MNPQTICSTCGTYYPNDRIPTLCTICNEERQYIPDGGQRWTTTEELHRKHSMKVTRLQENLYELEVNPTFAIGQRALLVLSEQGNILWDCIPLLDEATIAFIQAHGGLRAIAFSHPHYYSNMNDWAEVFQCPVYIHRHDAMHIVQQGPFVHLWQGDELALWDGMKLLLIGGHFEGSTILHVPFLSSAGSILCGDTVFLSPSKKHFSVQRSYPNKIPLPAHEMRRITARLEAIPFDAFYGYIKTQNLFENVKSILHDSMQRYFA